jgi:hypothetical protein
VDPVRLLIIASLLAILWSLALALVHLSARGSQRSGRMLRALTWRIGLSVALLAFLVLAAWRGWIVPHGLGR